MGVIKSGYTLVAREPIDIQVEFDTPRGTVYVSVKELTFKKTQAMTSEHSSGTALPYHLTEGAIDYEGEFKIGTWFTSEENHTDAEKWEFLLYYYLERPYDEGRPFEFNINLHERDRPDDVDATNYDGGGGIWMQLQRCKLTGDSFNMGESGTLSRTYPFKFLRRVFGTDHPELGGGFAEDPMPGTDPFLSGQGGEKDTSVITRIGGND